MLKKFRKRFFRWYYKDPYVFWETMLLSLALIMLFFGMGLESYFCIKSVIILLFSALILTFIK